MQTKSLSADYLQGAPDLRPFYKWSPTALPVREMMANKSFSSAQREILVKALHTQYQGIELTDAVQTHLALLSKPNTFTLTTGHQLCLLGGPMFSVYKVLSAICLAEEWNLQYPEAHFVPVFWIHTEDHDFEEINHYYSDFSTAHTYNGHFKGAVGRHVLDKSIADVLPAHLPQLWTEAYQTGRTLAEAHRLFFHAIFGKYGLIILDADSPELKRAFVPVIQSELQTPTVEKLILQTNADMQAAGYAPQVLPKAINLFYLDEEKRDRITLENDKFVLHNSKEVFKKEVLQTMALEHPEKFSPNVCLRPLYQEMILPNLVYFGGWAEVGYWLQFQAVFQHFGVAFPAVLPRMSATIFPEDTYTKWQELGFDFTDLQRPLAELEKEILMRDFDDTAWQQQKSAILSTLSGLENYVAQYSDTLPRTANALQHKTEAFLNNLEKKLHKAFKARHPQPFHSLRALKQQLQPNQNIQERVLSLAAFAADDTFIEKLKQHCQPTVFEHVWVR